MLLVLYKSDDAKGIPEFWLTAMKNVDMLADMIQVCVAFVVHPLDFQCDQHLISMVYITTLPSRWVTRPSTGKHWILITIVCIVHYSSWGYSLIFGYYTPVGICGPKVYGFCVGLVWNRYVFHYGLSLGINFCLQETVFFFFVNADEKFIDLLKSWYHKHHLWLTAVKF